MRKARRKTQTPPRPRVTAHINDQIRAREVLVVDEAGEQAGVMSLDAAIEFAETRELDLVEVAPEAEPPVCRVLDYSKWRYEEERKRRVSQRKQQDGAPKELRLRPRISEHDYGWKRDRVARFLRERSRVRLVVSFRGREREHVEAGRRLLARFETDLRELGHAEGNTTLEGRRMTILLTPNGSAS